MVDGSIPMTLTARTKPNQLPLRCLGLLLFSLTWLGLSAAQAEGQNNYLSNGSFDNDIAGWAFYGDANDSISWAGTMGFPSPGSLRLTAIDSGSGAVAASECVATPAGSAWALAAMALEEPGSTSVSCGLQFLVYFEPDCSDLTSAVVSGSTAAGSGWTHLELEYLSTGEYQGLRAAPTLGTGLTGTGACNFDSVVLTGPPNFAEVPATGPGALATLIGALALAGAFLARRLR